MRESAARPFPAYSRPLETIALFKYLGRILTTLDDDWTALVRNLGKSRNSWAWLARILGSEGTSPRVLGMFFKAVVQAVLVLGAETWVTTLCIGRALEGGGGNTGSHDALRGGKHSGKWVGVGSTLHRRWRCRKRYSKRWVSML